ncbi:MAG: tRNA pseudouridine(13) synthase TruD [Planctomycetota bacterium]|nr:tRNA pseudouridine(13) synthase TruD [Planctomycetota bacterium]
MTAPTPSPDIDPHCHPARFLSAAIPGIGGVIKQRPEDFLVDETPLYEPSGSGEHIYLFVQKRDLSTLEMVRHLASHFGVRQSAIGYAGLKDKCAITRQVVSVHAPGKKIEDFPSIKHDRIAVLWADYHANKLRRGHLKGNRFSIRVRSVGLQAALAAHRVLQLLARLGVPNRIGPQRFGSQLNNHLVGAALVRMDYPAACDALLSPHPLSPESHADARRLYTERKFQDAFAAMPRSAATERDVLSGLAKGETPERAWRRADSVAAGFFVTAFQSAVFNHVLDDRLARDALGTLLPGDVAMKHDNRACFSVDDETLRDASTAARLASFEISASGPMWSATMMRAQGPIDELERATLASFGVTLDHLRAFADQRWLEIQGDRRPFRVPILDPDVEGGLDEHGPYVRCSFELPRGSFATVVLAEVMKNELSVELSGSDRES